MKTKNLLVAAAFVFSNKAQAAASAATNQIPAYVCIDLHQNGFMETGASSIADGQLVGFGTPGGQQALLWFCGSQRAVRLTSGAPFQESEVYGTSGTQQVGTGFGMGTGDGFHALLWSGTPESVVDLNPVGFLASEADAVCDNQEVGDGWNTNVMAYHALLWFGSASNAVDLHPAGFKWSFAWGTSGNQQVGFGILGPTSHALLWSGTAASVVDLNPPGFTWSLARGIFGTQQGGSGYGPATGNYHHALLWSGTASNVVDLNPTGCIGSDCSACYGNYQVGAGSGPATGGGEHAILWSGTPESAVDLHQFLSSDYTNSGASGIDKYGNISGAATYAPTGFDHALEWVPLPNSIVISNDPGVCGATWTLPNCALSSMCSPPFGTFLPIGTNLITCTITNSASSNAPIVHTFTVTVKDCEPPKILCATASPQVLWPPNNQMQAVRVNVSATDNCHVAESRIISVTSNESDGNSDWQITSDLTLNLRASRSGSGSGRIYTITVQCTDDSGNAATNTVSVTVPRAQ